ncbi:phosphatase PAP2 family protein [Vibrio palustris]|uniref:Extracellular serine protease n=1 Tax=Vibrio palustris TaxID=1918946 RepID=A0A1R4B3V7_9VIBR|nr:phosphatase PAP2 family protein [Vibrio palustris]SJL83581.1 Extracellular serine protease precursor [Vibrio palustris]
MLLKHPSRLFAMTAIACAITACHHDDETTYEQPEAPHATLGAQSVPVPTLSGTDIAVVDGDIQTTNNKHNAEAYTYAKNPILQILRGFDEVWYQGESDWANFADASVFTDGPAQFTAEGGASNSTQAVLKRLFNKTQVRNEKAWHENFDYVRTLTRSGESQPDVDRNDPQAMALAYLDDQRQKGFSITSGLGPLASLYRDGANSTSPFTTNAQGDVVLNGQAMDVLKNTYQKGLDKGTNYGTIDKDGQATSLNEVVSLLNHIRDYGASTEAPKYHFVSPRPWRLNRDYSVASYQNVSDLTQYTCLNADGSVNGYKYYDMPSNPISQPMLGLLCAGRTIYTEDEPINNPGHYDDQTFSMQNALQEGDNWISGRAKDGAYPSGHTTEAYDRSLGMAYAIPQRFQEMVARAGDLGENRIVASMHSPFDVIGGRIMGLAVTAATLSDPNNIATKSAAVAQANLYFEQNMPSDYDSVNEFAHCTTDANQPCNAQDAYADHQAMKEKYRAYMTYGFSKLDEASKAPQVPKGAEVLLETRLPYLTTEQRRAVLASTEIDSNYPVINESRGWGRINLVDAADGYGAFNGDVDVYMDASKGGFYAADRWRNDIAGIGMLHKSGTGKLSLEGNNSYQGGTLLDGGTLAAASNTAFGTHTLYQNDGTVQVSIRGGDQDPSKGTLSVSDYVIKDGSLALDLTHNARISAQNSIYIEGGTLRLTVPNITTTTSYEVLNADYIEGQFSQVIAQDTSGQRYTASLSYSENTVTVTLQPRA